MLKHDRDRVHQAARAGTGVASLGDVCRTCVGRVWDVLGRVWDVFGTCLGRVRTCVELPEVASRASTMRCALLTRIAQARSGSNG
eukprot:501822-Rhodomonas_salina.2